MLRSSPGLGLVGRWKCTIKLRTIFDRDSQYIHCFSLHSADIQRTTIWLSSFKDVSHCKQTLTIVVNIICMPYIQHPLFHFPNFYRDIVDWTVGPCPGCRAESRRWYQSKILASNSNAWEAGSAFHPYKNVFRAWDCLWISNLPFVFVSKCAILEWWVNTMLDVQKLWPTLWWYCHALNWQEHQCNDTCWP